MSRRRIIAGNWKMNMTPSEAVALCDTLKDLVVNDAVDVVYCVPAIDIVPAPMDLKLKQGALVMFVKNGDKWHNGSMGIVEQLNAKEIIVQLLDDKKNDLVVVKPEKWEKIEYARDENDRIVENEIGSYKQFPLMSGYAMTIHKSQGKTLSKVIIDISRGAFAHGQTYVALSRTRCANDMHIVKQFNARDVIFDNRILDFINE